MSLQENIHEESRHKDRSKRKLKQNRQKIDDKTIGKNSSVHNKSCSCFACGNPRKYFNEKTIQEKRFEQDGNIQT